MILKNIIIINDYGYIEGGASNVAITTAIELAKSNLYNIYFICGCGPICKELQKSNIKKIYAIEETDSLHNPNRIKGFIKGIYNYKINKELRKTLKTFNNKETIIHIHTWTKTCSSVIFKVTTDLKFKTFITLHDYFWVCPNGGLYNYKKKSICNNKPCSIKCITTNCDSRNYFFKAYRIIRHYVQIRQIENRNITPIFISKFSKDIITQITEKYYSNPIIYDPISYNTNRNRIQACKNENFLFIGRISEEKGIRFFCEAIKRTKTKGIIIGDGPILKELKVQYPNIKFTGWLSHKEIDNILNKSRCMIFPSLCYETLGLTVLEAQSQGIPCIVPHNNASSENIKNNFNGFIFETGNLNSLVETIEKCKDNDVINHLSQNAYNSFNENIWNISNHINKILSLYTYDR